FQQRFDFKLYNWEFEHFIEYGLEKRPGAHVEATAIDELRKIFAKIAEILDRQTGCLNHRDYHSWNLMIHDEAVHVIDFQDALLAPPQSDLEGLTIHADEFFEIYRLSAIQRDLKVVGRFYYLDQMKGKPGYMKFVPPTVRRLRRNLAQVTQTKSVLPLLEGH